MGLASALNTALTGMTAAETTIDVVGNNLANANTVGFKSSSVSFATQFLQTTSLGSSATETLGGLNPTQIGLGVMVAAINVDFSQGTIQISSSSTDMAIQGEGFFIVQGSAGERLYTRNGVFTLNALNQLTTSTGNLLLGYGVNKNYEIDKTSGLRPITIPLGSKTVAQATRNVYLEGSLSPTGDLATSGQIIATGRLTDGSYTTPDVSTVTAGASPAPSLDGDGTTVGGGALTPGATYYYRLTTLDTVTGTESMYSNLTVSLDATENAVDITDLGTAGTTRRLYRSDDGGTTYYLVDEFAPADPTTYTDTGTITTTKMNTNTITGTYTYYVTYYNSDGMESAPSDPITATIGSDGRILLSSIPTDSTGEWDGGIRIYRNLSSAEGSKKYYEIADISITDYGTAATISYTDSALDSEIEENPLIDFYGPAISDTTLATDVLQWNGEEYVPVFTTGTLQFTGSKGNVTLATKSMTITAATKIGDILQFMSDSMGIVSPPGPDPDHPIPTDSSGLSPGYNITSDGKIEFISNSGTENAVSISLSDLKIVTTTETTNVNLQFNTEQTAVGESTTCDMVVYDSLGQAISVKLTCVLQSRTSSATIYRWYADSAQNISTTDGNSIAVGTGLMYFDGEGNFVSATNTQVQIARDGESAANSPLTFNFDFSAISGLATSSSSLAVSSQDGCSTGTLTSFIIGSNGIISGVFSNGTTRTLGQVVLARFANTSGLVQEGENLYSKGVNSGEPVTGTPGSQGLGEIVAGAQELSNTDIGSNLVDLILASTQYRGNTRVVSTVQDMLDELLALGR
jgi:flagellar hook protein FlgE